MSEHFNLPPLHTSQADFAAIRSRNGFYVDKTRFFGDLLAVDGDWNHLYNAPPSLHRSHLFMARPRRFGKTLLLDTLETWFQGLPPEHPASVAGKSGAGSRLAISLPDESWTAPAWLWESLAAEDWHGTHGWHPVIRLDMSRTVNPNLGPLQPVLQGYLLQVAALWRQRGVVWDDPWTFPVRSDAPDAILSDLIRALEQHYKRSPVVLVDEYDAPLVEFIGTDGDVARAVAELRQLYRVLKDNKAGLYGVFMTGITRFARRHLFLAANNFTDISEESGYGDLCGFTEDEVDLYCAPYRERLADLEPTLRHRDIQADWRVRYNGYRFSRLPSTPRVYNPFTLTSALASVLASPDRRREAAEGIWPSAWSESGHPGLIARLANDTHWPMPGDRTATMPDDGLRALSRPDYTTLMLETGYYTWHGGRDGTAAHLNFPNLEVAEMWTRDILELRDYAPAQDENLVPDLKTCLVGGDVEGFRLRLEGFMAGIAHQNLQAEAPFRTLLQALFLQMGVPTQSEKSTLGGRSDHEVQVGDRIYVFEVKYNRPASEARDQIRARQYGREHLDRGLDVVAVALALHRDLETGPRLEVETDDLAHWLAESEGPAQREQPVRYPSGSG